MITTTVPALHRTLSTIRRVQGITATTDPSMTAIYLIADRAGRARLRHYRGDGDFTIDLPMSTGTPFAVYCARLADIAAALPAPNSGPDTVTITATDDNGLRISLGNGTVTDLATADRAAAVFAPDFTEGTTVDLGTTGLRTLATVCPIADPRSRLPMQSSVAIFQRHGAVESIATDTFMFAAGRVTSSQGPSRAGSGEVPVVLTPVTLSALSKLPGTAQMTMTAASPEAPRRVGEGAVTISADTWTFTRRSLDVQWVESSPHIDELSVVHPVAYRGTVELNSTGLADAVRDGDGGGGRVSLHYLPRCGDMSSLLVIAGIVDGTDNVGVVDVRDEQCGATSTMAEYPNERFEINPRMLRTVVRAVGKGRRCSLAWGHRVRSGQPLVRIVHPRGIIVMAAINKR